MHYPKEIKSSFRSFILEDDLVLHVTNNVDPDISLYVVMYETPYNIFELVTNQNGHLLWPQKEVEEKYDIDLSEDSAPGVFIVNFMSESGDDYPVLWNRLVHSTEEEFIEFVKSERGDEFPYLHIHSHTGKLSNQFMQLFEEEKEKYDENN